MEFFRLEMLDVKHTLMKQQTREVAVCLCSSLSKDCKTSTNMTNCKEVAHDSHTTLNAVMPSLGNYQLDKGPESSTFYDDD